MTSDGLLGPVAIRALAAELELTPSKRRGQNFVTDANTVRRIVRIARPIPADVVLEVGPGLGSLTLGLLPACAQVIAIEIEPSLAAALPRTVTAQLPRYRDQLRVIAADAMTVSLPLDGPSPTLLVANLPYNVAVPVLLRMMAQIDTLRGGLVMVQAEVADRLAAEPGSKAYGVPSVKLAWFADVHRAGSVGPNVFWPVPRVDSGLVAFHRRPAPQSQAQRADVFACIDAAFSHRRKTLRGALAQWAGSPQLATRIVELAGIDAGLRGEVLRVTDFARIADARLALSRT